MPRTHPFVPRRLLGLFAAPVLMVLAGCSGNVSVGSSDPVVEAADVETQVAQAITDQGGADVTVACAQDLQGVVDEAVECDVENGGEASRATVTVTSVEGTDVRFDISTLPLLAAEDVAAQAAAQLPTQADGTPPAITCPDDLLGEAGTTMVCELAADGETYDTTITVTGDDGDSIAFDIQVADAPS